MTTHPPWCAPFFCNAGSRAGAHRTEPFPLDLSTVEWHVPAGMYVAYLEQPVEAAGAATTYLRLQPHDAGDDPRRVIRVPLGTLDELLAVGSRLAALDHEYVREDPEEEPQPLPSGVTGYRVQSYRNQPGRFARPSARTAVISRG